MSTEISSSTERVSMLSASAAVDENVLVLRIGVDFGTDSIRVALIDLSKKGNRPELARNLRTVFFDGENARLSTTVAIVTADDDPKQADLFFSYRADQERKSSLLRPKDTMRNIKLSLEDDRHNIPGRDYLAVTSVKKQHEETLQAAKRFETITAHFGPDHAETVVLGSMDDVLTAYLKHVRFQVVDRLVRSSPNYFNAYTRVYGSRSTTGVSQADDVWQNRTQVAFSVPTSWSSSQCDRLIRLARSAGWPTDIRTFPDSQCAVTAYLQCPPRIGGEAQPNVTRVAGKVTIVCDVGHGSLGLTALQPLTRDGNPTLSTSMINTEHIYTGGEMNLEHLIEKQVRHKLRPNMHVLTSDLTMEDRRPVSEEEFCRLCDYDRGHTTFGKERKPFCIPYHGATVSNVPAKINGWSGRLFRLSHPEIAPAYLNYAHGIIQQIAQFCEKVRTSLVDGTTAQFEILLTGNVAKIPFVAKSIETHFAAQSDVQMDSTLVKEAHYPTGAAGCALLLCWDL